MYVYICVCVNQLIDNQTSSYTHISTAPIQGPPPNSVDVVYTGPIDPSLLWIGRTHLFGHVGGASRAAVLRRCEANGLQLKAPKDADPDMGHSFSFSFIENGKKGTFSVAKIGIYWIFGKVLQC